MTMLHYQFHAKDSEGQLTSILKTGTVAVSETVTVIDVPRASDGVTIAAIVRVLGSDLVYAEARQIGEGVPDASGSHASPDAYPRQLFGQDDGACLISAPSGGKIGLVTAAAIF